MTIFTAILVATLYKTGGVTDTNEISYNQFLQMVEDGKVEKVEIQDEQIVITEKKEKETDLDKLFYTGVVDDDTLPQRLEEAGVDFSKEIPDNTSAIIMSIISTFLPIVIMILLFTWIMGKMSKGGGMMGFGKSNAKMYVEKEVQQKY